jgi:hypothetical protein
MKERKKERRGETSGPSITPTSMLPVGGLLVPQRRAHSLFRTDLVEVRSGQVRLDETRWNEVLWYLLCAKSKDIVFAATGKTVK